METTKTDGGAKAPIIIRAKDRAEWLVHRQKGIGSSEVATILGLNEWETPYQLWLRKRGMAPPKEETQAMKLGHLLEPVVADLFAEATGAEIKAESVGDVLYIDPERDFFRASPDRLYELHGVEGILECKSTRLGISQDSVPRSWMAQLQYQMMVSGIHSGHIAWLKDGREFDYIHMAYSQPFCEWMSDQVERFYRDCIVGGREPELSSGSDVSLKYPRQEDGKALEADENALSLYDKLTETKARLKALEGEYDALCDHMRLVLGSSERLEYAGRTLCTYKAGKDRTTFDQKRFRAEHPEIAEAYLSTQPASRTLLIK